MNAHTFLFQVNTPAFFQKRQYVHKYSACQHRRILIHIQLHQSSYVQLSELRISDGTCRNWMQSAQEMQVNVMVLGDAEYIIVLKPVIPRYNEAFFV